VAARSHVGQPHALTSESSSGLRRGGGLGEPTAHSVPPAHGKTDSNSSLLLRPGEVAMILGIGRSKVFELLAAHELPSLHIGRSTRIPRQQLDEWIQAQICWQPRARHGLLNRLQGRADTVSQ
jgi:excisionase family DNA binding protein